jgi:hypothetical protein
MARILSGIERLRIAAPEQMKIVAAARCRRDDCG